MDTQSCAVESRFEGEVSCSLCPDVIEWNPQADSSHLLAYGTYQLDEGQAVRRGAVHLAHLARNDDGSLELRATSELEIPGVYDVAWSDDSVASSEVSCGVLAVAAADGALRVLRCSTDTALPKLEELTACLLVDEAILTHVTWGVGDSGGLAAVGQDGVARHVVMRHDGVAEVSSRASHDLEAWCVEVSASHPHLLLSGADDGHLIGWDVREPPDGPPALVNRCAHEAGVTALACDPFREHHLATGSYDERVRSFDLRLCGRGPCAETEKLGDGAYHLAWHPCLRGLLAVAAMRSGLPLLGTAEAADGEDCGPEVVRELGRYAANAAEGRHGSLAYGVSWQAVPFDSRWLAASASFYDKTIQIWSVPGSAFRCRSEVDTAVL